MKIPDLNAMLSANAAAKLVRASQKPVSLREFGPGLKNSPPQAIDCL
jgi:hypothetical protein